MKRLDLLFTVFYHLNAKHAFSSNMSQGEE
jgi:hypothetical protein